MNERQLKDKRAAAWAQMQDILARSEAENRDMTAEERSAWDAAEADITAMTGDIERLQRAAVLDTQFRSIDDRVEVVNPATGDTRGASRDEYRDAFETYLRYGMERLNARQQDLLNSNFQTRDQGVGTGAAGGFTVPQGFWAKVTETLKFYSNVASVAEVVNTDSGNSMPWATNDDTSNEGVILAENTAETGVDLTFGQKTLGAYMYSSRFIKVSRQLLQDTGIDIEAFTAKKIGQRLGRITNRHFTVGTGTSQPQGFVVGATTGVTATAGNTTGVSYDFLVDLVHSVDAAYRESGSCVFQMHDLSIAVVRKLKDSTGAPLWQPSVQAGAPDTLLGYPVRANNYMATMAANAKSIAFGDFGSAYVVRAVNGGEVLRLTERFADALQVGFLGFGRFDGLTQDPSAVKLYVNSAT